MSYIIQDILKLFIQEYVIMENATVVKSVKINCLQKIITKSTKKIARVLQKSFRRKQ